MKTIVFAKSKGGVAATTLCYNVALMAAVKSQVFLIDRDPQGSLRHMWEARNELINPRLITDVESVGRAVKLLVQAGFDRDFMFVDTPGSMMPIIDDALQAADLIVVPTQPSPLDSRAQDAVLDRIERLDLTNKMMIVLTRTQPGKAAADTNTFSKFLQLRSSHPIPTMAERVEYRRAAATGKAAWELSNSIKSKELKAEIENIWRAMRTAMQGIPADGSPTEVDNVVPLTRR